MDYQRREWLQDWGGAHVFASITDGIPDLHISDGVMTADLLHYHAFDDTSEVAQQGHEANVQTIRTLIAVLSEMHSKYLEALHPESVTR